MKTAVFHGFHVLKCKRLGNSVKTLKTTLYWVWALQEKSRVLWILKLKTAFHCFTCSKVQRLENSVKTLKTTLYRVWAVQQESRVLCIPTLKTAVFHCFHILKYKDSGTL